MTAERCRSVYLRQPLLHMLTEKADSCIHLGGTLIHTTHTQKHTRTPSRGTGAPNTITFSSLLEGRKNSGATWRLLCPCGTTHWRLLQRRLGLARTRPQLLNRKSPPAWPCASSNPPSCLVGSRKREESQN